MLGRGNLSCDGPVSHPGESSNTFSRFRAMETSLVSDSCGHGLACADFNFFTQVMKVMMKKVHLTVTRRISTVCSIPYACLSHITWAVAAMDSIAF